MKYRTPFQLKGFLAVYNILQIILCIYFIINFFNSGYKIDYLWKCYKPNFTNLNLVKLLYFVYFIKGIEFIETICFLLKKNFRQVSFLHVYHHISTFIFTYLGVTKVGGKIYFHKMRKRFIICIL